MVPSTVEPADRLSQETADTGGSDTGSRGEPTPSTGNRVTKLGGVEGFRKHLETTGVSKRVSAMVVEKWKGSSRNTYESGWKGWNSWCSARDIDPHTPSEAMVAEYLLEKFDEGLSYDHIGVIRSAISAFARGPEGTPIGQCTLIKGLMKGFYNKRTPRPRYTATWSIDTLLEFWKGQPVDRDLDLKDLTIKVTSLLAVSHLTRASDLNLMLAENHKREEGFLEFLLESTPKHQRKGLLEPLTVYKVSVNKIDPVSCLIEYLDRTQEFRLLEDGITRSKLFLSYVGRHKPVTTTTISNWIKLAMDKAGIDTSTYRAHSTRSAGVSSAFHLRNVSIKAIMRRGKWSNSSILKKYYLRRLR